MKTFLTICIIGILSFSAQAQVFPSEVWHDGTVVLINEDTLKGLVKYDIVNDHIQLRNNDEKVLSFSAQKLFYFEIYDKGIKSYRQFYSLPYRVKENYSVPILFEVLYEGRLTLLSRERIVMNEQDVQHYKRLSALGYKPQDSRLTLAFDFYFLEKDGTINKYLPKKRLLLSIMDRKYNEVKKYIKRNNLRHDHITDLVRITAYYNALGN